MKEKGLLIMLGVVIFMILTWWLMQIGTYIKISKNIDDYEIVEATIVEIKVIRANDVRAVVNYNYDGQICYEEVSYYDKYDGGKNSIQIAVDKNTGEIYRTGIPYSYLDISGIFVAICSILLIFAKIHEDKVK